MEPPKTANMEPSVTVSGAMGWLNSTIVSRVSATPDSPFVGELNTIRAGKLSRLADQRLSDEGRWCPLGSVSALLNWY